MAGPTKLGPYSLKRPIGEGGMGVVYEAIHEQTGARYALKTIAIPGGEGGAGVEALLRFRTEGEAMARLDHPHVVKIHEAKFGEWPSYLVEDLLEGGSLQERLRDGPFDVNEAVSLTIKLARAAQHAHDHGVVHRDLKPSNVLFDERGEPRLVDFGLALDLREKAERLTKTGTVMGSPGYMAPEQALGEKLRVGPATDVYGLGAVLYAMLTGDAPFKRASFVATLAAIAEAAPRPPRKARPGVPAEVEAVCLRALAKDPQGRFASAGALAEALESSLLPKEPRGRARLWAAAVCLVAACSIGVAWSQRGTPAVSLESPTPTASPTPVDLQLRPSVVPTHDVVIEPGESGRGAAFADPEGRHVLTYGELEVYGSVGNLTTTSVIRSWDLTQLERPTRVWKREFPIASVAVVGSAFVIAGQQGGRGKLQLQRLAEATPSRSMTLPELTGVAALAVSPDASLVAVAGTASSGGRGRVLFFRCPSLEDAWKPLATPSPVRSIAFTRWGLLAGYGMWSDRYGERPTELEHWEPEQGVSLGRHMLGAVPYFIEVSPSGSVCAVGETGGQLNLFDLPGLTTWRRLGEDAHGIGLIKAHESSLRAGAFDGDGAKFYSASGERAGDEGRDNLRLWTIANGKGESVESAASGKYFLSLERARDGRLLAGTAKDGVHVVWPR